MEKNSKNSTVTPLSKAAAAHVKIDSISIDLGKAMDKRVTDKCHHFSLRQYCVDKRNQNVRVCAPFARDSDDEVKLREQLPPLDVPKFRWWRCQSCVQDIEKASPSSVRGEIHPSPCSSNKEKDNALVGSSAVQGQENGVKEFSGQLICDQTLSLVKAARQTDETEPASDVAATNVLAIKYPGCRSSSSSEKCLAEKANTVDEDQMTVVGATEMEKKDIEIDANTSAKDVKKASSTRRKKKVRSMAEILHVNDEERSDQLASHNTPKECAAPASISASRKRKINQEPFKEMQIPGRKPKKVRASKGDAITTIATIHNSGSESVEDDASAGTGFKSRMSLPKAGNEPCPSKMKTKLSHGEDRQSSYKSVDRGNYKEDIGLDLSLNSYMEVDKNIVPNKKTTLNNDHWMKEGSRTGPSSVPDFSFSKDIEEDMSGRIANRTDINCQHENSLSLRKKLELSLGCSSKKAAEPKRFSEVNRNKTDQRSETVFEKRSYDDIPMDIVELMAKHQYERGLSEAERNSCLTKRIDERNYEMMGLSDVNGNRMRPLLKEHNRWIPVKLSQADNNHCVVGNREGIHVLPVYGTCSQTQQKESFSAQRPQPSASRTFIATQNLLWTGDRMVHRSSSTYAQVIDTNKTANNGPTHLGMAANFWASGASSLVPSNPNFPLNISSGTSNMTTYLPYPDLHKGKTVRDLDLNRTDPNDSDVEVLCGSPVVASNTVKYLNLQEMNSVHSYSNEAIPAMHLLSLMDAGTPSRPPFSINTNKVLERPFFPGNYHPSRGMDERAVLFEKPLFPQNHQVKEHPGPGPSVYRSSASTAQMPSAYYGPNIVTCQQPVKANKTYIPQQSKDWMFRTSVGTAGASDMIRGSNLHQGKQKGILGATVDLVFPAQPKALKITENQKDVGSRQMHGTIRPLRDISKEEVCSVNRNPADFSSPEAGSRYMIRGGDLKFSKDYLVSRVGGFRGPRRHGSKLTASKRQAVGRAPTAFP
ncbi:hypothetical protein ACET3Z_007779 [Daucus carota]